MVLDVFRLDGRVALVTVANRGIRRAVAIALARAGADLDAVFHLCQAAGRAMLDQGHGKIINLASMLSSQGGIRVPSYTAAKHAVVGLSRALANEWPRTT